MRNIREKNNVYKTQAMASCLILVKRQTSSKINPSPSRRQRHQRLSGAYTNVSSAADDAAESCNWPFRLMDASHPEG